MAKIKSGDKLYLCDRKQCGDRCHYPECRHTSDISHAVNAPTFPNGFERVDHGQNVYFVEKENIENDTERVSEAGGQNNQSRFGR